MSQIVLAFLDALLTDQEMAELMGAEADLAAMLRFEVELAAAQAGLSMIPADHAEAIRAKVGTFLPDVAALTRAVLRDGVIPPDLIRQLRGHIGGEEAASLHFGATSQDVIDTALALKLKPALGLLEARLGAVTAALSTLIASQGDHALMGRTRMQAAIPITARDRIESWRAPLARALSDLAGVSARNLILTLSGAAGTSDKYGDKAGALRQALATGLGLTAADYTPHAQRDRIVALGSWLSQVTGALGKMGQDAALMAQNEMAEIVMSGGGASSAMAHKQNPVLAETLVALARFNAVQISGLHQSLVHEQERSGAAWTLEWMILPPMLNATATALAHAEALVASIRSVGKSPV
jgi:3-carboxy-cis,cis-muconate cycloisomerase